MTIDISKIRPGDEVLVRCVATAFKSKDDIYVDLRTHRFFVQQDHIAGHTPAPPKPLEVGCMVAWLHDPRGRLGEVLALDGGVAWVKWSSTDRDTYSADALARAQ